NNGVVEIGADEWDDENGEHQAWYRHDQIHDAQDDHIDDAAEPRGREPEYNAGDHRDHHHREADEEGDAAAIHEPREHVAPERIGAQGIVPIAALGPDRWQPGEIAEMIEGIVRRQHTSEDGNEDHRRDNGEADDGTAIFAHRMPDGEKRAWRIGGEV